MDFFWIDLSDRDLWLLGAAGVCFTWLVSHALAFWRDSFRRLTKARIAFRSALNPDIAEVASPSRIPDDKVYVFLASNFHKHNAAVLEFSAHLGGFKQRSLTKDWAAYASNIEEIRQRYDALSGTSEASVRRALAVSRLKKIVSHGS